MTGVLAGRRPVGAATCSPSRPSRTSPGVQHPLDLVDEAHDAGWDVLVDAAAFAPTNRLDVAGVRPDFVTLSFYKIFGFPTGVGCLLMRARPARPRCARPWFAGGTITIASVQGDGHYLHADEAAFEDGTVDYLNLPAVETGLRHLERIGRRRRSTTGSACLTRVAARRADRAAPPQRPPASSRSTGRPTPTDRGGTVTFLDARPRRPPDRRPAGRGAGQPGRTSRCAPAASATPAPARSPTTSAPPRWRSGSAATSRCRSSSCASSCSPSTTCSSAAIRISRRRRHQLRRRLPVHVLPAGLRRPHGRRDRTGRSSCARRRRAWPTRLHMHLTERTRPDDVHRHETTYDGISTASLATAGSCALRCSTRTRSASPPASRWRSARSAFVYANFDKLFWPDPARDARSSSSTS